ncbi:triose-phosphate isomerase [Candidatus Gillettellia adelgis]
MRYPLVIGNWKLNGSTRMVNEFIASLRNAFSDIHGCNVAIAPPVIYLDQAKHALNGSRIALGAQNVDINMSGAFTGEISAHMLKDVGVQYVIIGHSESRIYHKETDTEIAKKFAVLKAASLIPILCIGETEKENIAGKTTEVCSRQINAVIHALGVAAIKNAIIAYEPIWAIGTGKSATPFYAQAVHKFIRNHIAKHNTVIASEVMICYGGSVNDQNAAELFSQPDINGALIGSASLKIDIFSRIVKTAIAAKTP